MHKPYRLLLPLFVAVAAFAVVRLAFAVPPLPTSFYGTVVVDGAVVAPGTPVTAYIDGVAYATTGTTLDGGQSVFLLHVPGDDPDTGAVEGGTPGATVSFTIGALTAVQTATWQSGVHRERALVAFSVPQPPDAAFVVDKPIAVVGETIAFTDTSTDIDGALVAAGWEFGDGATSTLANPSHAYAAHGVFDVTLTVTDSDGLTDSAVQPVTVRARPVAAFTYAPAAPRAGETVVFTNTATDADGTIVFYSWDFGDGAGSGDADPTHVFATTGTRLVTLTVTDDDGLSDSATMLIPVVEPPDAAFTVATAPAVAGEPVAFIDQSATPFGTLVGWGWDFGDGVGSAAQNPVHVFATHGAYTVTLVVTDSAAFTDTATQTVSVLARPAADFTWDPLAPAVTQTVAFTDASADADGALIAWLWDFDDGATATGPAPTYTFGAVGRYDVHLTVTDTDGLAATALRSVIVSGANAAPTAAFTAPLTVTEGAPFVLDAALAADPDGALVAYLWDLDADGAYDDATGVTTTVTALDDGAITVALRVIDDLGGRDNAARSIAVLNAAPTITAGADLTTTAGALVALPATVADPGVLDPLAVTFDWGDGAIDPAVPAASGATVTGTHAYVATGTYTATVCAADDDGGVGCDTARVTVGAADVLSVTKAAALAEDADGSGDITPGDTLAYTIIARNVGPVPVPAAVLSDALDSELTLPVGSVQTTQGTVLQGNAAADRAVEVAFGDLAAAGTATVTFRAVIADPLAAGRTDVGNQALVSGANAVTVVSDDPTTSAPFDATRTPVRASADLALTTGDGRAAADPGAYLVYRLIITNSGNLGAHDVVLTGTVPTGAAFAGADGNGTLDGATVTWTLGSLAGGAAAARTLVVRLADPLPGGLLTVTHTAAVTAGDGVTATAGDVTAVAFRADLAPAVITRTIDAAPQNLAYSDTVSLRLANRGNAAGAPFDVTFFADGDGDGALSAADAILGVAAVPGLAAGSESTLSAPVAGTLPFRNAPVLVYADSGDVVVERSETNNVVDSAAACVLEPPPTAPFDVAIELDWPGERADFPAADYYQSRATPLVANLTDDNGDGAIDDRDMPDILFTTFRWESVCDPFTLECYFRPGSQRVRAIDGVTGTHLFTIAPPNPYVTFARAGGLAVGDLDGDARPEILIADVPFNIFDRNRLYVYEDDGAFKFTTQTFRGSNSTLYGASLLSQPSLHDVDGDGSAEIVVGATVFNSDGTRRWQGTDGFAHQAYPSATIGRGALSTVADLDLDGKLEIVAGRTAYRHDGAIYWDRPDLTDGWPAVGNFNTDAFPEVVVSGNGTLRLHAHDGALLWEISLPGGGGNRSGAPAVADFDGDGAAEIAVTSNNTLSVVDGDGALLWQAATNEGGTTLTGVAAFDLDGDGAAEVIYRDRRYLRIFAGADGAVLYELIGTVDTEVELPVVADVDRDGSAEIIVTWDERLNSGYQIDPITGEPIFDTISDRRGGVMVLGHTAGAWRPTRPIWNQHAFFSDHVDDGGRIEADASWPWLTHNTFRANIIAGNPDAVPDLSVSYLRVDSSDYPRLTFTARVGNGGAAPAGPGQLVDFYDGNPDGGARLIGTAATTRALSPGAYEDIAVTWDEIRTVGGEVWARVRTSTATPDCIEANNTHHIPYDLRDLALVTRIDDGVAAVNNGDRITYTVFLANLRDVASTGATVQATLPPDLNVISASDGGAPSGDTVIWPAFTFAAQSYTTYTLVAEVDPAIPLSVRWITTTATIDDDGALGPDPTPENNADSDSDKVLTVSARPGGPYLGVEGDALVFDASASYDRDGTIVSYEWDLDGDGIYEASGLTTTLTVLDDREGFVYLRVTDDSGELDAERARLRVVNAVPQLSVGPDRAGIEGDSIAISPTLFTDLGVLDTHTVTVNWGDGFTSTGIISATQGSGEAIASHVYPDNGVYSALVCLSDDDGGTACDTLTITTTNAAPLIEFGAIDLFSWTAEGLNGGGTYEWQVAEDGLSVRQARNNGVTFFYGPYSAIGNRSQVTIRAQGSDDDYIGFVLGFEPNDSVNPNAHYLTLAWKRQNQGQAPRGLALLDVRGVPIAGEFWAQDDLPQTPFAAVTQLARGATLGDTGWVSGREYAFTFEYAQDRVLIWVDDVLQFDLRGDFPPGRLGFYNYSQANVTYSNLNTGELGGTEGSELSLVTNFGDRGADDTHTVTVDWQDGVTNTAAVTQLIGGGGILSATHIYADNGEYFANVCVTDDDGATGCDVITATVRNEAPLVNAGPDRTVLITDALALDGATFFDPGVRDTFAVSVTWGDGAADSGTWTPVLTRPTGIDAAVIVPAHTYTQAGDYAVALCVIDDDGGVGCDPITVTVSSLDAAIGGPSVITEGVPLTLTGSIVDLDGAPPYTYTWDLGDDTVVTGTLTVTHQFVDEGVYDVRLDVVNGNGNRGFDILPVTVLNAAPVIDVSDALSTTEGALNALAGSYTDLGVLDLHLGEVDWGDGESEYFDVNTSNGAGTFAPEHVYVEDGAYAATVCILDNDSAGSCRPIDVAVANVPPTVTAYRFVDMRAWETTNFTDNALWDVFDDGLTVRQTRDRGPSLFTGIPTADEMRVEVTLEFEPHVDNDYGGFAIGFTPGEEADPSAEWYLIDWRQTNQALSQCQGGANGVRGLALSRVFGVPQNQELWHHSNTCEPFDAGVEEIARAATLGSTGYVDGQAYRFAFDISDARLRVWVDGVLEFDVAGAFSGEPLSFYAYSQPKLVYRDIAVWLPEGSPQSFVAEYTDPGVLDTHVGQFDWGDGFSSGGAISETVAGGSLSATRAYPDSGQFALRACVDDDDGGSGCRTITATIRNVAPVVTASADTTVPTGQTFTLPLAAFDDPGVLDTHTAVIDWGDGTVVTRTNVNRGSIKSATIVTGTHQYAQAGVYNVTVTVIDKDDGVGQDSLQIVAGAPTAVTLATTRAAADSGAIGWILLGLLLPTAWVIGRRRSAVADC